MDKNRIVAAVSREGGHTWFEVLDFSQNNTQESIAGTGDQDELDDMDDDFELDENENEI